ncbi:methylosome subunit [Moniliophthora roreri MCA 2997]|uniref:Methylosome subunit n=2 Tax=Moniliophthora roreri TaxID=221103 RepID=V2Y0I1_MONRO|nr:methylosome subunit [Moniliophthora roreri MCA 2997]KAI3604360.1 methylosome subunit [Moniliophthora roreri]
MTAVTLITSTPQFISQEEYKSLVGSTPASFNDIPPVLRHKEENVSVSLDPPLQGFSEPDAAQGTLYVIESTLAFTSTTGRGFQIEYPSITLHAISRSQSGPSIYCQLDETSVEVNGNTASEGDAVEDMDMRELNIVPQNESSLEPIFEALSICAALHPDPPGSDDEGEDDAFIDAPEDGHFEIFTGDKEQELSEVGRAALAHLESIIYDPADQQDEEQAAKTNGAIVNGGTQEGEAPPGNTT